MQLRGPRRRNRQRGSCGKGERLSGHIGKLADQARQHKQQSITHTHKKYGGIGHDIALTMAARYARRHDRRGAVRPQTSFGIVHMTTFDKREEGFEKKFAHDEELRFKANARRNKLLGLWAAEKLGLSGAEADAYAKEVVVADFEQAGDDVFQKVRKDFDAKGVAQSDHQIRRTMTDLLEQAIDQIKSAG
jgi:hypothetical protein